MSHRGTLELDATGRHVAGAEGEWIIHPTYDALGRLARLQRPLAVSPNLNHIEHYCYDGVRRVQKVFTSLDAPTDGDETPGDDDGQSLITWAEREYIHTAGPGSYVDEYVCEVGNLNTSQTPLFHLQDANYNVLGLVSAAGSVVRQYTLDPYGQLLHREDRAAAFESRVGHQGLFLTRLDAPQGHPDLTFNQIAPGQNGAAPLTTPVDGIYYTPNRTYSPRLGRWMQRDPNGTAALVVLSTIASPITLVAMQGGTADPTVMTVDGANLHAYMDAMPVSGSDPLGLFEGMFGLLMGSTTAVGLQSDWMQQVTETGVSLKGKFETFFEDYAFNQLLDADWAEDWDSWDDAYSSSGITYSSIYEQEAAASADQALAMGALLKGVKRAGEEAHHIATLYGSWGRQFKALFARADHLSMNNAANLLPVLRANHRRAGQRGHSQANHAFILSELTHAVEAAEAAGLKPAQVQSALISKLDELKAMISLNPRMINYGH